MSDGVLRRILTEPSLQIWILEEHAGACWAVASSIADCRNGILKAFEASIGAQSFVCQLCLWLGEQLIPVGTSSAHLDFVDGLRKSTRCMDGRRQDL